MQSFPFGDYGDWEQLRRMLLSHGMKNFARYVRRQDIEDAVHDVILYLIDKWPTYKNVDLTEEQAERNWRYARLLAHKRIRTAIYKTVAGLSQWDSLADDDQGDEEPSVEDEWLLSEAKAEAQAIIREAGYSLPLAGFLRGESVRREARRLKQPESKVYRARKRELKALKVRLGILPQP